MASNRLKWIWWLAAALVVVLAARFFFHRSPSASGRGETADSLVVAADGDSIPVVRDTVYVTVDDRPVAVVRERPLETEAAEAGEPAPAAVETVIAVPLEEIASLIRIKSGRDISLSAEAPDRITFFYSGKVDVPMVGEQEMNLSAGFKVVEVSGDRLVLQLDSGSAMNLAAEAFAPIILEHLPKGFVQSFSGGRAVIFLSAFPQLKQRLQSREIVGFSLDEEEIRLRTVEK